MTSKISEDDFCGEIPTLPIRKPSQTNDEPLVKRVKETEVIEVVTIVGEDDKDGGESNNGWQTMVHNAHTVDSVNRRVYQRGKREIFSKFFMS